MNSETINDKRFGQLIWDSELERWSTCVELIENRQIELNIEPENSELETVFEQAHRVFKKIQNNEFNLRLQIASALGPTYTESWNDGSAISQDLFATKITLYNITLHADGRAKLFYDDDDLFDGNSIIVELDPSGEFQSAAIAGQSEL
jgi:hypothetical protein